MSMDYYFYCFGCKKHSDVSFNQSDNGFSCGNFISGFHFLMKHVDTCGADNIKITNEYDLSDLYEKSIDEDFKEDIDIDDISECNYEENLFKESLNDGTFIDRGKTHIAGTHDDIISLPPFTSLTQDDEGEYKLKKTKSPDLNFIRDPEYVYAWIRLNETLCFADYGWELVRFSEGVKEGEECKLKYHKYYKNGYYHDNGFTLCKKLVGGSGISRAHEFSFIKSEMDKYDNEQMIWHISKMDNFSSWDDVIRNKKYTIDEIISLLNKAKG